MPAGTPLVHAALEWRRVSGVDDGPDAATKAGAKAGRGQGAAVAGEAREDSRLLDLVAEQMIRVGLRVRGQRAERGRVGGLERLHRERDPRVLANEVAQAVAESTRPSGSREASAKSSKADGVDARRRQCRARAAASVGTLAGRCRFHNSSSVRVRCDARL